MNKYQIILDVYETQNITKSAERLNYTPSAVSQAIKAYEKEIGMEIFVRSQKGVKPRPDAEEIFKSIRTICNETEYIDNVVKGLTNLQSGSLRVGSIQSVSYNWLPQILDSFAKKYNGIHFDLTVDRFQILYQMMEMNRLDCAFVSEISARESNFIPLWRDELVLVLPDDHPLARKDIVNLEDINGVDYVMTADGWEYEVGEVFRKYDIQPNVRYQLNEDYSVMNMVQYGFGITILPKLLLRNAPFKVCVRTFEESHYRTLGVTYRANPKTNPILRKFLEEVRNWKGEIDTCPK